jgi:phage tail sheath protein FI
MPVTPTYPGVYIEEIPSGVHTITGVATSIGAFVDTFTRGPIDTAVQVLSMADFEREFGGLNMRSEASYAIQQFFLNGGSQAFVIRVGKDVDDTNQFRAATVTLTNSTNNPVVRIRAGERIRGASVLNPGTWGNFLRIEVDRDVAVPDDPTQTIAELFNISISEVAILGGRQSTVRSEVYRNLTFRPGAANNALQVVNEGSKLVQLDRDGMTALPDPFTPVLPQESGTVGADLPMPPTIPAPSSDLKVSVSGGQDIGVALDYGGTLPADYQSLVPFMEASIRAKATSNPVLADVTVRLIGDGTTARPYRLVVGAASAGGVISPTTQFKFAGAAATTLKLFSAGVADVQFAPTGAGVGGDGLRADKLPAAALTGIRANKTGLFALEDADLFNILCIPATANLASAVMQAVVSTAVAYCKERRAFMIVDIPSAINDPGAMQAFMAANATLRDRNAAIYFPQPRIPDPLNGFQLRSVGGSGTMAGVYAATDTARGVWKAPAGTEAQLRGVSELRYVLTDGENGLLNPLGINALRNFAIFGNVAWGARTLDGADQQASEWKYIPVRRFALYLEESLYRGTKWVVFEPNDEPLWAQIRLNVGAFMHNLFVQGAFQGRTPREAYFVKCDAETTTQNDIDLGIVNVVVGFAPLKPAEFVIIRIQQTAGQVQT